MKFSSTKKFDSKTCEGVSFTIRVMTEGVRARLALKLADPIDRLQRAQREAGALDIPRTDDGDIDVNDQPTVDTLIKLDGVTTRVQMIRKNEIDPSYFQECFVSIEGLEIDGETTISVDLMKQSGPLDLYEEMIDKIRAELELTNEQRRNLESPTTSGAEAGGPISDSTAPSVETTSSSSTETVDATTQS